MITHSKTFTCDGLVKDDMHPSDSHPKIYLNMGNNDTEMVCPYCSEVYKYIEAEI